MNLKIVLCAAWLSLGAFAISNNELARQAYLGVTLRMTGPAGSGAEVGKIDVPAVAAKLGLKTGDHILEINGRPLDSRPALRQILRALHGGDKARFKVAREGKILEFTATLDPLPNENLTGVEIIHGSVRTDGGFQLRTIITRPSNKPGKLPVIFVVGWLSCDSVEYPFGPDDGFGQLLHDVATRSGMVLFRTDKAGTGDSEGPDCSDLDFQTELAGYRASFSALQNYDFIDTGRIFVLGMSNGGGFAPLVVQDRKVKAYIVTGAWVKTWFEHMIELERRRTQLAGMPPDQIASAMKGYSEFYDDYLIQHKTPGEIIKNKARLAKLWSDEPDHQYGRPASFYYQLEDLDLLSAWAKVNVPVLALHGEYDWIMSRNDHEIIAGLVDKHQPGAGKFSQLEKTNHLLFAYPTPEEAFKGAPSGHYNPAATSLTLDFLRTHQ